MMIRSERNGVREEERKQDEERGNHCNCWICPFICGGGGCGPKLQRGASVEPISSVGCEPKGRACEPCFGTEPTADGAGRRTTILAWAHQWDEEPT